jgi:hypothetical protein
MGASPFPNPGGIPNPPPIPQVEADTCSLAKRGLWLLLC